MSQLVSYAQLGVITKKRTWGIWRTKTCIHYTSFLSKLTYRNYGLPRWREGWQWVSSVVLVSEKAYQKVASLDLCLCPSPRHAQKFAVWDLYFPWETSLIVIRSLTEMPRLLWASFSSFYPSLQLITEHPRREHPDFMELSLIKKTK